MALASLSVALIGPDEPRRKAIARVLAECPGVRVQEFSSYPADLDEMFKMLEEHHDVVIVDLDGNPKLALNIVESICDDGSRTVMVFSEKADRELVVRCMRAGAREFLALPITAADMADALARVSVRLPGARPARRKTGSLFVFLGAKGGCGVTTLASNFAVSLAQESGDKTLLIDLGLPLGDVAINLGIVAKFSTDNAFQDPSRLDTNFLSSLLTRHASGLFVLAAPGEFSQTEVTVDAVDKLLAVARQSFDYVVVDAGSRLDLMNSALFEFPPPSTWSLRSASPNCETQIAWSRSSSPPGAVNSRSSSTAIRLMLCSSMKSILPRRSPGRPSGGFPTICLCPANPEHSHSPRAGRLAHLDRDPEMARTACGLPEKDEKKKGFSFFGRAR
jgi:pilus assembly protein CpaE